MTDLSDWDGFETSYKLANARIVATLIKGGAIVEDDLPLMIREGRQYTCSGDLDDPDRSEKLEYHLSFETDSPGLPESKISKQGSIVITGRHPNGHNIEIQGKGWIGYDEKGRVDGFFERPPIMSVLFGPDTAAKLRADSKRHWERLPRFE